MLTRFTFTTIGMLILSVHISSFARADETSEQSAQDVTAITSQMKSVRSAGTLTFDCDSSGVNSKPSCSALSGAFCSKLNGEAKGNLKVRDGGIYQGYTSSGAMKMSKRFDLEALVASEKNLPADFQKRAAPILKRLKALLANEKKSDEWDKSLSKVMEDWDDAIEKTENERIDSKRPELKPLKWADLNIDQKSVYSTAKVDLENQILKAKYANHPNWKRVERVFEEAKANLIEEVDSFNLKPEQKEKLRAKLKSVTLTLPFNDSRISTASSDCGKVEENAFYSPDFNNFTVCAGYFNSFQSDSAMYPVIAHELGHSIDSTGIFDDVFKASPVGKVIQGLAGASGPAFSCDEWNGLTRKALNPSNTIKLPAENPYHRLTACLYPNRKIKPLSDGAIRNVAERNARTTIASLVEDDMFLKLSQPTIEENGKTIPNLFYMRPDRYQANANGNIFPNSKSSSVEGQIFVQALSCQRESVAGQSIGYDKASEKTRLQMFERSMQQTMDVIQAIKQSKYSLCGQECEKLAEDGLSKDATESVADWLMIQSLPRYLSHLSSAEAKRDAIMTVASKRCDTGSWKKAWKAAEIQKQFALEPHPQDHRRQMSYFSPEVADAISCNRDDEVVEGAPTCGL